MQGEASRPGSNLTTEGQEVLQWILDEGHMDELRKKARLARRCVVCATL
jgi:hypothetical protein